MMMFLRYATRRSGGFAFWLLPMLILSGCGGGGGSAAIAPTTDGVVYDNLEDLKQRLGEVAKNGDGGSSLMGLSESAEKLRATDPKKADIVAKGVAQLDSAGTPAQRKAIAAKLLKDL
jgi:hypothetical protein